MSYKPCGGPGFIAGIMGAIILMPFWGIVLLFIGAIMNMDSNSIATIFGCIVALSGFLGAFADANN